METKEAQELRETVAQLQRQVGALQQQIEKMQEAMLNTAVTAANDRARIERKVDDTSKKR